MRFCANHFVTQRETHLPCEIWCLGQCWWVQSASGMEVVGVAALCCVGHGSSTPSQAGSPASCCATAVDLWFVRVTAAFHLLRSSSFPSECWKLWRCYYSLRAFAGGANSVQLHSDKMRTLSRLCLLTTCGWALTLELELCILVCMVRICLCCVSDSISSSWFGYPEFWGYFSWILC